MMANILVHEMHTQTTYSPPPQAMDVATLSNEFAEVETRFDTLQSALLHA